jgi:predicted CoA-substrate-specific enzyme activase
MPYFMGIDIGSTASKGVIIENGNMVAYHAIVSGVNYKESSYILRDALIKKSGIPFKDIASITATGYGADSVDFSNQKVDDIRACARGIVNIFPKVRTVIDVQGQRTQVFHINEKGRVTKFLISEKCAAGSGRFLQIIASILQVDLNDIGTLSLKSKNPVGFTTGCAVFCESEAVSRISEGFSKEDILAGVHDSMANKIASLMERLTMQEECAITGASALDVGLVKSVEKRLGVKLRVPRQPQFITALGAAIMAEKN